MTESCARIRRSRPLLGTFVDISLEGADEAALHRAADLGFAEIRRVERLMSRFDPDSDVSAINRIAPGGELTVAADTWRLLALAQTVMQASDGAFDITVASAPADTREQARRRSAGIELLPSQRVRIKRRLSVDLGGIAKGFAVDAAVDLLATQRGLRGTVNAGGDLRSFGGHQRQVRIRDPLQPARHAAMAQICDEALATSAVYAAEHGYARAGLVVGTDGRGLTLARSATVRASRCAIADALAKVVLLLGERAGPALARFGASGFVLEDGALQVIASA